MGQIFVVLLAMLGLLGYLASKIYNELTRLNSRVNRNFSGIDTQLSRRHAVIKKLVASVGAEQKNIINQFEALTNLIEKANLQRGNQQAFFDTENQISRMWNQILNLPQLKSIRGFQDLNKQIAEIEEEIAASRRTYNDSVERFNTYFASFPAGFIAQLLFKQFQEKAYFQATAEERQDIDINFNV
ncbi:LemA family protein (plasmid) [Gloeothece citriformis PCC 7424]|uniref:LemA family protein n=1 Tax=Gloeothece citriformis (strain PCC 7424) TaxID=65393 RepID=B7KMF5_GLOC7|nr:LemA family protein [Gloeothece citriformis]ACK73977.1 LemA family protein [Gloeothece citriformis PCC 7424]